MSLDLNVTALKIDQMVASLKVRENERKLRLDNALGAIKTFGVSEYNQVKARSESFYWHAPQIKNDPVGKHAQGTLPDDFCVVAVDGSHIDIDRHLPVRCSLINIGVASLNYGSHPDANLFSQQKLYVNDELVIRDKNSLHREQAIEGVVLSAKRAVEEIETLSHIIDGMNPDVPTIALIDGSLVMMGLDGHAYGDFVKRELIEEGFVKALNNIHKLATHRTIALASYISLPRSAEIVNALRIEVCPFDTVDCRMHCNDKAIGERPCDHTSESLLDREIFSEVLEPGERSGIFISSSDIVSKHYGSQKICFFYVNTGEEIGRVEIPSWVAENEELLRLFHSAIVDQCRRGSGYPTALIEAHEQAVVNTSNRRDFTHLIETALYKHHMPVYSSEKNRSKRLRSL